jgi:hypothetical protein
MGILLLVCVCFGVLFCFVLCVCVCVCVCTLGLHGQCINSSLISLTPDFFEFLFCTLIHSLSLSLIFRTSHYHYCTANLAWNRLSSEIQHQISAVLNITNATEIEEYGSPMGIVANWADHVRHYLPWSGELHFVDVRDDLIEGGCHYLYNSTTNSSSSSSSLCDFDYYDRDCVEGNCVVGAVFNYSTQLLEEQQLQYDDNVGATTSSSSSSSTSTSTSTKRNLRQRTTRKQEGNNMLYQPKSMREALMFLIHFIGDVHQPLHVSRSSDRGGNDINVKYHVPDNITSTTIEIQRSSHHHSYNLHSVWDTAMIKTALERRDYNYSHDDDQMHNNTSLRLSPRTELEGSLESFLMNHPELLKRFTSCQNGSGARHLECVIEWGNESWERALKYAYTKNSPWNTTASTPGNDDNTVVDVVSGDEIDEEYYQSRLPIVKEQLIAGGIRLAATLEDIFRRNDFNNINDVESDNSTIEKLSSMEGIHMWSSISSLLS